MGEAPHIKIRDRKVGPGEPVYFIAEIGLNHNGNPELARRLIDLSAKCGADAVKFQKRNLKEVYRPEVLDDLGQQDKELQYIVGWLQQVELSDEVFADLTGYAHRQGVEFLCSPWDRTSVDLLERLGIVAYKMASADMTNFPLLEYVARTGKPMIISTGMSDWREIERTVAFLRELGADFAMLHCQSTYPAAFKDVNLRAMLALEQFGVPVGYSGHERGIAVSTSAAALGACIIERHVTLDRTMQGPDHASSLEPQGLEKQVRDIRVIEESMGQARRGMSRGEILTRHSLGKSLAAARPLAQGQTLTWDDLTALSPGATVSPQRAADIVGKPAPRDMTAGELFREADLTGREPIAVAASFPWPWGAVVRFHDCVGLAESLKPAMLEFHLTDMDLDSGPAADLPEFQQKLSVHCPEYYHGKLLDLCATDEETRRWSVALVARAAGTAEKLREHFPKSGTPALVVHTGAMSYEGFLTDATALRDAFSRSADELRDPAAVRIVYENLPPYPWYFGGQWYGNYFCEPTEMAEAAQRMGLDLCLDTSHAQLWCRHAGENLADFITTVAPWVKHLHVADASGVDGEGLQIGMGEIDFADILPRLVKIGAPMVMEVWLGHHGNGEGFATALARLTEVAEQAGLTPQ